MITRSGRRRHRDGHRERRRGALSVIGERGLRDVTVDEIGAKAYNLMRMTEAGLPVPPGFVLGTAVCQAYNDAGVVFPDACRRTRRRRRATHRTGDRVALRWRSPSTPWSPSGPAPPFPCPACSRRFLDVGLSDATLPGLLRMTGDPLFVWDSYRRLIQSYGEIVEGCAAAPFAAVARRHNGQARRSHVG